MKLTERQNEIVVFLESLVGKRTTIEKLNDMLEEFFKTSQARTYNLTLSQMEKGEFVEDTDYHLMFNIVKGNDFGYYDIYYLQMLKPSNIDNDNIYITEVNYDFID